MQRKGRTSAQPEESKQRTESKSSKHSEYTAQEEEEQQEPPRGSNQYNEFKCNLVIWGKWKSVFDQPIQLNLESDDPEGGELKQCFVDMIAQQDYCLFTTDDGSLYAQGLNDLGMLGLGKTIKNTLNKAKKIVFPDNQRILDFKVGRNHALALTTDGKVYGWGMNNHGQVGVLMQEEQTTKGQQESASQVRARSIVWEPKLVYPTVDMQKEMVLDGMYDYAKQIEIYEDSSFLVTEDGLLYSWGKNDQGFLGREAKLDIKMMAVSDKKKKLTFSTSIPGRVTKLEKFQVQRIAIKEGKIMVFFVESVNTMIEEEKKDSEIDSEEEKDVVEEIPEHMKIQTPMGGGDSKPRRGAHQEGFTGTSDSNIKRQPSNKSFSSHNSSRMTRSNQTGMMGGRGNRNDKQKGQKWQDVLDIFKKAQTIRDELAKFDRALADSVKPLTDLNDKNIYYNVIDKFSQGQDKKDDAAELQKAIDRMQVQLGKNAKTLNKLESRINEGLKPLINSKITFNRGNEEIFNYLLLIVDLLNESLAMKKFNLVGCKMKVYQERMREINFLELLQTFRESDHIDIDRCSKDLMLCKKLCKKIKDSLMKNTEVYLQMHVNCSVPSSLALSALTNSVYVQCDLWQGLNQVSSLTCILQSKLQEAETVNEQVRHLWSIFIRLQKTDFNKKVEIYKKNASKTNQSTREWFDLMMKEIHKEIKEVLKIVQNALKEDKGEKDILHFFQVVVQDAAIVRQLLYSAQQALFEGAHSGVFQGGSTPGFFSIGTIDAGQQVHQPRESQRSDDADQANTGGGLLGLFGKIFK